MEVDSDAADPLLTNGDGNIEHGNEHESAANNNTNEGICEECEDRRSRLNCPECDGGFCDVCFHALHRKGKRALHRPEKIARPVEAADGVAGADRGSRGGLLKGWIGPRLPAKEEVNPDMHDRWVLGYSVFYVVTVYFFAFRGACAGSSQVLGVSCCVMVWRCLLSCLL